tara:strand:- start:448 stop:966 length:519 start_codon:yes stop_codon:yes gene_type:complete
MTIYFGDGSVQPTAGIVQCVSTTTGDRFSQNSLSSGAYTNDVMTLAITPSDASNKILILASLSAALSANEQMGAIIVRDSTILDDYRGPSDGNRARWGITGATYNSNSNTPLNVNYLDHPNTTSAVTYRIRIGASFGGGGTENIFLNRTSSTDNETYRPRSSSTLTLMEVAL